MGYRLIAGCIARTHRTGFSRCTGTDSADPEATHRFRAFNGLLLDTAFHRAPLGSTPVK